MGNGIKRGAFSSCVTGVLVAAMVVAVPLPAAAATIIDLGTLPGGRFSYAVGINASGVVAGTAERGGVSRAVRWSSEGIITELGALPGTTGCIATAINDAGAVIGYSGGAPVRWNPDGTIVQLQRLPGDRTAAALDINNAGIAVGNSTKVIPVGVGVRTERHAVRWGSDGDQR